MSKHIVFIFLVVNGLSFLVMGLDKTYAKKGLWRVPERALLMFAACGGSFGIYAGMRLFHHKTKHKVFKAFVPSAMAVQAIILIWIVRAKIF